MSNTYNPDNIVEAEQEEKPIADYGEGGKDQNHINDHKSGMITHYDDACVSYSSSISHFIIPPMTSFKTLCLSYDKTELFLVALVRTILWISLLYIYESKDTPIDTYAPDIVKNVLWYIILVFAIINMLVMAYVINKTPKYNKKYM
jgi:hypothetical protein